MESVNSCEKDVQPASNVDNPDCERNNLKRKGDDTSDNESVPNLYSLLLDTFKFILLTIAKFFHFVIY